MRWPHKHPTGSLGIEEEFQIVSERDEDLVCGIEPILELEKPNMQCELFQSIVETTTLPAHTLEDFEDKLIRMRQNVHAAAASCGYQICSAGTHAFASGHDQIITDRPRYHAIVNQHGDAIRNNLIFGLHVHVAINNPDDAVRVYNGLSQRAPYLIALAANAPFWLGKNTGVATIRPHIFENMPHTGIGPIYHHFADYQTQLQNMQNKRVIKDATYLWHDVRLHPKYGTVEVRAFDSQTRWQETLALAELVRALALAIVDKQIDVDFDPAKARALRIKAWNLALTDSGIRQGVDEMIQVVDNPFRLQQLIAHPGYVRQLNFGDARTAQKNTRLLTN